MKKQYEKNETVFAIICIIVYVAGTGLAEALTEAIGVYGLISR